MEYLLTESLDDLTDEQYRRCAKYNLGKWGYMQEWLEKFQDYPDAYAIMAFDAHTFIGWGLVVPVKYLDGSWISRHCKQTSEYCAMIWVLKKYRKQGWGEAIMKHAESFSDKPLFVYPHDPNSGKFFKKHKVTTLADDRYWMRRSA